MMTVGDDDDFDRRMEDTENLRSRLRERRRTEERKKATEKEKREVFRLSLKMNIIVKMTMMMGRYQQMERNKRRREAKEKDHSSLSSIRSFLSEWMVIMMQYDFSDKMGGCSSSNQGRDNVANDVDFFKEGQA